MIETYDLARQRKEYATDPTQRIGLWAALGTAAILVLSTVGFSILRGSQIFRYGPDSTIGITIEGVIAVEAAGAMACVFLTRSNLPGATKVEIDENGLTFVFSNRIRTRFDWRRGSDLVLEELPNGEL
jgi:hypothetical protein